MASEHLVYFTNVFPFNPLGGNPCPVVLDAKNLTSDEMLVIANHYQLETAFVIDCNKDAMELKYFVPKYEMEMCVHATLGSLKVMSYIFDDKNSNYLINTKLGFIESNLRVINNENISFINQFLPIFSENNPPIKEIIKALNIDSDDINLDIGPIQSVSSSRPKLMIPVKDYNVLSSIKPNFEYLWKLCNNYNTTGFYPFTTQTRSKEFDIEARQFPKNAGFPEDPATGVAAGALACYLTKYNVLPHCQNDFNFQYKIGQGFDMKKPSIIYAENEIKNGTIIKVMVGGKAEILRKEKLSIFKKNVFINEI